MAIEIEYKFLAKPDSIIELGLENKGNKLVQGYLSYDPTVRVRVNRTTNEAFLTIKGSGNIERTEFEYKIPIEEGEQLLDMCCYIILKERYNAKYNGKDWVIDHIWFPRESHGDAIWLAEIELKSVNETFDIPPWTVKDVSTDSRYKNAELAKNGPPATI